MIPGIAEHGKPEGPPEVEIGTHSLENATAAEIKKVLASRFLRLNSLYYIKDKAGKRVLFKMNKHQYKLFMDMHYLNLILKARQLGFSTLIQIFMLDACLFNENLSAGVVADTLKRTQKIFAEKISYPYQNLPSWLLKLKPTTKHSTTEIAFKNGSSIFVDTSMRGGTLQILHVSEYGKICAVRPDAAREIRTGALNTVAMGQLIFIESTAEGQDGDFYEMTMAALQKFIDGIPLTVMDYKFFFFAWWQNEEYKLEDPVVIPSDLAKYFADLLHEQKIELTPQQKAWYVKKAETQKDEMMREYPSYPEEAFMAAAEGAYYAKAMNYLTREGRICDLPISPHRPVSVFCDIGMSDYFAAGFLQRFATARNWVDYVEGPDIDAPKFVEILREKKYWIDCIYLPHDGAKRDWGTGKKDSEKLIELLSEDEKLKHIDVVFVPKLGLLDGIKATRNFLMLCYFHKEKCAALVRHLRLYKKKWNERTASFEDVPNHDEHSHGSDMTRYAAVMDDEDPRPASSFSAHTATDPSEAHEPGILKDLWSERYKVQTQAIEEGDDAFSLFDD